MARTDITGEKLLEWADWEWQDLELLKLRLIETVPPGKALRTYQDRSPSKGVKPLTEDQQIASGARTIVNARISSLLDSGKLEVNDERTQIRLRERRVVDKTGCCPTCRRPFHEATTEKPRPSSRKVVYPHFPAWQAEAIRKGVS